MKELIISLLKKWSCSHSWEKYYENQTFSYRNKLPSKIEHTLICKNCGKIKRIEV